MAPAANITMTIGQHDRYFGATLQLFGASRTAILGQHDICFEAHMTVILAKIALIRGEINVNVADTFLGEHYFSFGRKQVSEVTPVKNL